MAGVQAGSAGRLSIEIVAEIARLQQDMDRVRRVVNASGGDIAKMARVANDNLAGIGKGAGAGVQQFARDVAMLKAQLDPAWQAQQRYNQSVELGMRAFKSGAIDRQQFIQHMRQISAELKGVPPHMQRVTVAAGAQRAGMMQLSMQLNDVATMYALGARPMQIFASQAGQVIQAVQMMSNGTSKFAKFLGGPWGLALTTAAVVLVPLIGNLVSGKKASDDLGSASESLARKLDMQKHSLEEVTKALREYNAEQENARTSTLSALAAQSEKIANNIKEAISIRKNIDAMIDERGARLYQALGQSGGNLLAVPSLYAAQSKQLEQARAANQQYLKDLTTGAKNTIGEIATEMAKIQSDPRYAIEKRFEALRAQAIGAGHDVRTLTGILTGLNKQEQAAIKAYQESQKKPSRAEQMPCAACRATLSTTNWPRSRPSMRRSPFRRRLRPKRPACSSSA